MAKYNYDKSTLSGLSVKGFLGQVKLRESKIAQADNTPSPSIFNANKIGDMLHPSHQFAKVAKIIDHGSAKQFVLEADAEKGTKQLAYFRAGQYISVMVKIGDKITCRPYTLMSNPKDALAKKSTYSILIKPVPNGVVSNYIVENWKIGTPVALSGPLGHYFYTGLRDAKHVVALAGGSGITPFMSMACAIDSGIEDFKLTILYGSRTSDDILLFDELSAIEKRCAGKVKVVHVLSDEEKTGFEHGFLTADIIKKYAGTDDYSVFVCGPPVMYTFASQEAQKLGLPLRRFRLEVPGEMLDTTKLSGFKDSKPDTKHKVTVHFRNNVKTFELPEATTIMRGIEDLGIGVTTDCRSGKCGWCRSRLISGDVYFPTDSRRAADAKFNWIHPCCTYAKSDIEIEVFPNF